MKPNYLWIFQSIFLYPVWPRGKLQAFTIQSIYSNTNSQSTLRMSIAHTQPKINPERHELQPLIWIPNDFLWVGYFNMWTSQRAQGILTGAQQGAEEKEEREQRDRTNGEEERETTDTTTKAKKRTGAQRTDSEANTQTQTPQREETSNIWPRHKQARTSKDSEEKREQRGEDRAQANPRQKHYRRITEGLRKCTPNHSERTDNTGTN